MAQLTGLSVRTLHHYDQIGLLQASERTKSNHRMYAEADPERLLRIMSLRELGEGLRKVLESESEVRQRLGLDDDVWAYMQEAFHD